MLKKICVTQKGNIKMAWATQGHPKPFLGCGPIMAWLTPDNGSPAWLVDSSAQGQAGGNTSIDNYKEFHQENVKSLSFT